MRIIFTILIFMMSLTTITYSQISYDVYGNFIPSDRINFRLNSLESNPGNYALTKDWEFAISFNTVFARQYSTNLFFVSLGKRIKDHYLYARYTPGISKEFKFTASKSNIDDSLTVFETDLIYKEKFGFGYSYNISPVLTAGISFRFFQQEFSEEFPSFIAGTEPQVLIKEKEIVSKDFWQADFGISYSIMKNLSLNLSTNNFIIFGRNYQNVEESDFEIKKDVFDLRKQRTGVLGINFSPFEALALNSKIETNGSFSADLSTHFKFMEKEFTVGVTALHDRYQQPFIAGIVPVVNVANQFYSVTLSGIKYLSNRLTPRSVAEFKEKKISNIVNNYFVNDEVFLTVNFALSFQPEKYVKILDVEILTEIYPTLADVYVTKPFARGKIVNLSDKKITVKPFSFISEVNKEEVQSPAVELIPHDTAEVNFYTIVDEKFNLKRRKIESVDFIVKTGNGEPDDIIQKPILINDKNSWDGNVKNLKFFVERDYDFANQYAKAVLKNAYDSLVNVKPPLKNFYKVKILFDNFVKNMQYVADRRASVENVQFPSETIELKGGDCDDLSVSFAAVLESIGIQTAFVDYKPEGNNIGHVNLLVNTKLKPEQAGLITSNDKKIFIRKNTDGKDEVWIPLETTSLTNFETAWEIGAEKFYKTAIENFGLAKGTVEIIDVF